MLALGLQSSESKELAGYFDHTNLSLSATPQDIITLCEEAANYHFKSVMVYPNNIVECVYLLGSGPVSIGTVVGFPHGRSSTESKQAEIVVAAEQGAKEVDIVIDYFLLKEEIYEAVEAEAAELVSLSKALDLTTKIIIETCELGTEAKLAALEICENVGADFIKTSTGFGKAGAQVEDIRLFATHRQKGIKIKASGGVKTLSQACELINAGADRIGTSGSASIMKEFLYRNGQDKTIAR